MAKPFSVHQKKHVFIDLDSAKHPELWLHVFAKELERQDENGEFPPRQAVVVEEGGFIEELRTKLMTREQFREEYEIDCPEIFMQKGFGVTTVETEKKSDDWNEPGDRKFGVKGVIVDESDAHGLCYKVKHEDGTFGWYDPWELK